MSDYYQGLDRVGGFDYQLYDLPRLHLRGLRGPAVDLSKPYLAFVGAAQTFGRFATAPFATLVGQRLGIPVLNLGSGGAGPAHFRAPDYLELLNGAEAVVIQVLSGRSASNSLFDNTAQGGMTGQLRADKSSLRADEFFANLAATVSRRKFEEVVEETRRDYLSNFIALLRGIKVPRILLWLSTRAPHYVDDFGNLPRGVLNSFPQLVNRTMMEELKTFADAYVECVSAAGLPQLLWKSSATIDGAMSKGGTLENSYYPSPEMHVTAANALEAPCRRFLGIPDSGSRKDPENFVIVAAARTGTNLLIGMLNDVHGCFAGSELFNVQNVADDIIPWHDLSDADVPALIALRKQDPVAFWKSLCALAATRGYRSIGFKLLYSQGYLNKDLLETLAGDKSIAVIHLKRRNRLRRLVSERQAYETGKWWAAESNAQPRTRPVVALSVADLMTSLGTIEEHERAYDAMFADHPLLELVYEDLAERPFRVIERVAHFLRLPLMPEGVTVKHAKTGTEALGEAVVGHDALRARIKRWAAYFEE